MEKSFPRKSIKTTPRFYFAFFMFSLLTFTLYFYFQPSLCFDLCWKHCFRHDKFPTRPWHHNRSALANLVLFCFFFRLLNFYNKCIGLGRIALHYSSRSLSYYLCNLSCFFTENSFLIVFSRSCTTCRWSSNR